MDESGTQGSLSRTRAVPVWALLLSGAVGIFVIGMLGALIAGELFGATDGASRLDSEIVAEGEGELTVASTTTSSTVPSTTGSSTTVPVTSTTVASSTSSTVSSSTVSSSTVASSTDGDVRTYVMVGGEIVVSFDGPEPELVSVDLADGFAVESETEDGELRVDLRDGVSHSSLIAWLGDNGPQVILDDH